MDKPSSRWLTDAPIGEPFAGLARIIVKKDLGGVLFWRARYNTDEVQLLLQKKRLTNFTDLQAIHPGGCVRFRGTKCVTRTGEQSIEVAEAQLEVPCLHPLPDKYHGLQQARRYDNRMLDLLMNRDAFLFFRLISDATFRIREFLRTSGYREFNTGVLQEFFEAGLAQPFVTTCNANGKEYSLTLTGEAKLKQMLIAGYERVFEILQSFRNEGISPMHSPEFTLLEIYRQDADYKDMMSLLEDMIAHALREVYPDLRPVVVDGENERAIDFTPPYVRMPFHEACKRMLGLRADECDLPVLIGRFPGAFTEGMHRFTWIFKLISKYLAPRFLNPVFLTEIPSGVSPFVKTNADRPVVSDRAVLLINGMDVADVYTDENRRELIEQEMIRQSQHTGRGHNEPFLELLAYGLPPTASIGLGINRLFLALRGELPNNVKETILYPIK